MHPATRAHIAELMATVIERGLLGVEPGLPRVEPTLPGLDPGLADLKLAENCGNRYR